VISEHVTAENVVECYFHKQFIELVYGSRGSWVNFSVVKLVMSHHRSMPVKGPMKVNFKQGGSQNIFHSLCS